jgi:hypothetical protein
MANFGANLDLIPISLKADNEAELSRLMFLNNHINATKFNYMSPLFAQKKWVVWFYADIKDWDNPNDLTADDMQFIEGVS